MCLMDVALLPTPFPATPLYHDDRQDLIVHLIKASAAHSEIVCPLKSGDGVKILKSAKRGVGGCPLCFFSALCLFLWHPWIFSCYWSVLLPGFQNPLRSMPRWQGLLVITSRVPCVDFSAPECILLQYDILQPEAPVTPLERSKPSLRLEFPAL